MATVPQSKNTTGWELFTDRQPRRRCIMKALLHAVVVAVSVASVADVCAQGFPSKPVRIIVGSNVGSGSDAPMRIVAGPLGAMWKQQIVVENRVSAGGVVATEIVAKAAPDGHTLLVCSAGTHGISPVLNKKLPYDYVKDFTFISRLSATANALIVNPALPAKSVKEFVDYAKANPGKIQYGSSGVGYSPHLTMELLKSMAGINLIHASTSAISEEVTSGRVMAAFNNIPPAIPLAKAGRVRILAVTSPKRNAQLPDVPTMIESGFAGFEVIFWNGICGPAGVPKPIVSKINADLGKVLAMPETQKRFAEQGIDPTPSTPEQFAAFVRAENARWTKAAKSAGLEPQ
jgi:tripartite-type tricarboxylate transporter receptor subunit TctC